MGMTTKCLSAVLWVMGTWLFLMGLGTLGSGSASAAPNEQANNSPPLLFMPHPNGPQPDTPGIEVRRQRLVRVETALLGGPGASAIKENRSDLPAANRVVLNLFTDANYVAQLQRREQLIGQSGYAWYGTVEGRPHGQVVFVVSEGLVVGDIRIGEQLFRVELEAHGVHRVQQLDPAAFPDGPGDDGVPGPPPGNQPAAPSAPAADDGSVLDVLVAYTPLARQTAGGEAAMQTFIQAVMAVTNQAYGNSLVVPRARLVLAVETNYAETGNSSIDLSRLGSSSDGYMDELHTLRATYGADLVALITETGGCGIGYLYTRSISSSYTVTRRDCALGNLTFAHELGHNMGARHDWYVDDTTGTAPGGFSDNHGRVNVPGTWRTIMAYNSHCSALLTSCARVAHFSNPNVNYSGSPTGFAVPTSTSCTEDNTGNPDCDADNVRVFNATALTIANFEQTKVMSTITAAVSDATSFAGDTITYTLTVTNASSVTATSVVISDTVPANSTLISGTLSGDATATGIGAGSVISWNTGQDLAPGTGLTRTFAITSTGPGLIRNQADVGSSNGLTISSNVVETRVTGAATCGFYDSFESRDLGYAWSTYVTDEGRVRVGGIDPNTGSFSALLDDHTDGGDFSYSAIILTLDLTGQGTVDLDFWWRGFYDEYHPGGDGVYVSDDYGVNWYSTGVTFDNDPLVYRNDVVDIDATAASHGLTLNDHFQIKFQFYDNFAIEDGAPTSSDGYAIDDVAIGCGDTVLVWDGGGSTNNWSEAANWNPNMVPDGHAVRFDVASTKDAEVDTGFTNAVSQLTIGSGYTGTITQTNVLTVSKNFYMAGGTIDISGTSPVRVDGTLAHAAGRLKQSKGVDGANVQFLTLVDSSSNVKYRGVTLDSSGNGNDLGNVTVTARTVDTAQGGYCTTAGSASPPYVFRCLQIEPENDLPATVRLWAIPGSNAGIQQADLAVYRYSGGLWHELTGNASNGGVASFDYAEADSPGFSLFLLGNGDRSPTVVGLGGVEAVAAGQRLGWIWALAGSILLGLSVASWRRGRRPVR
jgi:uncharacterized repeat protein (TIGR01451 family)